MDTKRAVIYARFSSSRQREESIEGQVRECKAFAEYAGYDIVNIYADRAISGRTSERPEFQKMIADSKKKINLDATLDNQSARFLSPDPSALIICGEIALTSAEERKLV